MIPKILSRSQVDDISNTCNLISNDLSDRTFPNDPYINALVSKLATNNAALSNALKEVAATSELGKLDEARDNLLRVIFKEIDAKVLWPEEAISTAALLISDELDKYGYDTINMAYGTESANINALLQDMKKPEVSQAIAVLQGLDQLLTLLAEAQKNFEAAYLSFIDDNIQNESLAPASGISKEIRRLINRELNVYLSAMAKAKPETYGEAAKVVTEIIKNNNSKVRTRLKRNSKQGDAVEI